MVCFLVGQKLDMVGMLVGQWLDSPWASAICEGHICGGIDLFGAWGYMFTSWNRHFTHANEFI